MSVVSQFRGTCTVSILSLLNLLSLHCFPRKCNFDSPLPHGGASVNIFKSLSGDLHGLLIQTWAICSSVKKKKALNLATLKPT